MIDLTGVTHHPAIEEVVDVLCAKTQNTDRGFFRTEMAYFLGKMASSMRATIVSIDGGEIPVNVYALALATSGYGKGYSMNIIENNLMKGFQKRFTRDTFPMLSEQHLWEVANDRAARNSSDQQEEFDKLNRDFKSLGPAPFTFDSGTAPAVKQLRNKLLLSRCGGVNYQVDEIGSNIVAAEEVLNLFLELYDQGLVKQKLVKNTSENQRLEEIDGATPTNMLLFGTPVKLLDGGQVEDKFYSFLETGYARRCLFGWGKEKSQDNLQKLTAEQMYDQLLQTGNAPVITQWQQHFHLLADPAMYGWKMTMPRDVGVLWLSYKQSCEGAAVKLKEHEEIRKSELGHRHSKALKLAGAYAFVDQSNEITIDHLKQAILLVEESGTAFQQILNREKPYVKLAKYVAAIGSDVTQSDLAEALPFYKGGQQSRNDMMMMATAWGYKQHIIIKKSFVDGIEFFRGETLKETNLDEMIVSYSDHFAFNYGIEHVPFDQLHVLTQAAGMHWANHGFKNQHRAEENVIPGFNMLVIDVDSGTPLKTVHELMKDYKFMTYTTKRHQVDGNGDRFRLLLPINYHLELDKDEYKEFMENVCQWLPFKGTDEDANQRSRKWMSHDAGSYHFNDGALVDALPFIPKTSKNEAYRSEFQKVESLDNLERWFAQRIAQGSRNNQMIKYALALVDNGMDLMSVSKQVHSFNQKLNNPLGEQEIETTILTTVAKRYQPK